jgi:hypothetical protein
MLALHVPNCRGEDIDENLKGLCVQFAVRCVLAGNLSDPTQRGQYFAKNIHNMGGQHGVTRAEAIANFEQLYRSLPVREYSIYQTPILQSIVHSGDLIQCTVKVPTKLEGKSVAGNTVNSSGNTIVVVEYNTRDESLAIVSYDSPRSNWEQATPPPTTPTTRTTDDSWSDGRRLQHPDRSALYRVVNVADDDTLTLRSGPGASTQEVRSGSGDIVTLPATAHDLTVYTEDGKRNDQDLWYPVSWNGYKGYLREKYLEEQN